MPRGPKRLDRLRSETKRAVREGGGALHPAINPIVRRRSKDLIVIPRPLGAAREFTRGQHPLAHEGYREQSTACWKDTSHSYCQPRACALNTSCLTGPTTSCTMPESGVQLAPSTLTARTAFPSQADSSCVLTDTQDPNCKVIFPKTGAGWSFQRGEHRYVAAPPGLLITLLSRDATQDAFTIGCRYSWLACEPSQSRETRAVVMSGLSDFRAPILASVRAEPPIGANRLWSMIESGHSAHAMRPVSRRFERGLSKVRSQLQASGWSVSRVQIELSGRVFKAADGSFTFESPDQPWC